MSFKKVVGATVLTSLVVLGFVQCGNKDSTVSNGVNLAAPSGLAVASPTAVATARSVSGSRTTVLSNMSRAEKKALLESLFSATSLDKCAVTLTLANAGNSPCYGPSATFTNHPDGGGGGGTFPGGDLGIWEAADASGQACAAAQLNSRIQGSASYADAGMFGTVALLCAARVGSISLPAVGASVDMTASAASLIRINATDVIITAASLSREADSSDGFPVFVSQLTGTSGTTTYTIRLKHSPTKPDNSIFRGKVSVTVAFNDGTKPGNCSTSSATGYTIGTSVSYERASATEEVLQMRDAQFCGSDADPFASATDKTVDHTKKLSGGQQKGWANNANFLSVSQNPITGAGNFAYAWQAGMGDNNVRALNVNLVAAARGAMTGTAFFGFGTDMGSTNGTVQKMICNWAGPGNSHTGITKAQKQTLSKAARETKFTAATSFITYDPANACESGGATFSVDWTSVAGTPTSRTANTTTMDLVDTSTISASFTIPVAPTSVE